MTPKIPIHACGLALLLIATLVHAQPQVERVGAIGITVADLDRSVAYFTDVLAFKKIDEQESTGETIERLTGIFGARTHTARLRLGDEEVELIDYLTPEGRAFPADTRSNDRWFQHIAIVVSDIDAAYAHLRERGVMHASTGPQTLPQWNRNAAGIRAFYFRDPDGHFLEIIWFPAGKGDPRWHTDASSGRLFLGIDHTAIVVSDTDAALGLYRDTLGMQVVGGSENLGVEQEHLNNVFGARLRITTLKAPGGGPGIEFLEYLTPRDGRPTPIDLRASDVTHWHTTLIVRDVDAAHDAMLRARAWLVSPTPQTTAAGRAALVRDFDGHGLMLTQPTTQGASK